jgi:hypothetical protein
MSATAQAFVKHSTIFFPFSGPRSNSVLTGQTVTSAMGLPVCAAQSPVRRRVSWTIGSFGAITAAPPFPLRATFFPEPR